MARAGDGTLRWKRAWRTARHPAMLPAWLAIAAWSVLTICEQRSFVGGTVQSLRRYVTEQVTGDGGAVTTGAWTYDDLYAVSGPDGWRIIDLNLESADELSRLWQNEPERVVQVSVVLTRAASGLMADTRSVVRDRITLAPFTDRALTASEAAAIRAAAVDDLLRGGSAVARSAWGGRIARVRAGDVDAASTMWSGYGVNAAAIVGTAMSAVTLVGLMGAARAAARRWTERRRARRGLCAACGYSLAGVDGPVCPECGAPIAARAYAVPAAAHDG